MFRQQLCNINNKNNGKKNACNFSPSIITYDVSKQKILQSGNIESNPGPRITYTGLSRGVISNNSDFLFNYRLFMHGLRQLDVGGGGDCLFKSVSHQLHGDAGHY